MTGQTPEHEGREQHEETSAQQWADRAHALIEAKGPDGLAHVLRHDFVQESRTSLVVRREGLLGSARTMYEMGLHVSGHAVAVAGDLCVLTRRVYRNASSVVELLAVSVWDEDGLLVKLIEFDIDALDAALAELTLVAGQPAVLLPSPPDT
ncbi:MAG: hypothetical protein DRJ50_02995 [Actinobacteria bacterium]|nr:MAG: hypothetical protein DRJ50_02995 [Actinomycetota bacterium]